MGSKEYASAASRRPGSSKNWTPALSCAIMRCAQGVKLVTIYLVVHKAQIPCKRYCKLVRQMPYNRHRHCQRERT
jgi:hypothetical protein